MAQQVEQVVAEAAVLGNPQPRCCSRYWKPLCWGILQHTRFKLWPRC